MTNKTAVFLGLLIVGFFALDHFVLHWDAPVFLMRKLVALIEYLAFWR
jgi:hypothetical protein